MEKILRLKHVPLTNSRIWGDGRLARKYNCEIAKGVDASHMTEGGGIIASNIIDNGEYKGETIGWLYKHHPEYFGKSDELRWDILPFSLTAYNAAQDLSVQVHPNEEWAMEHLGTHGKAECWYFPWCEPGSTVLFSHRAKTKKEFLDYLEREDYEGLLIRHPIKSGDFHAIKGGSLHAIQKGCDFIEICNPTDITYRFYDYNRLENSKKRPLHIKEALENILIPDQPIEFTEVHTDYDDVHERLMADNPDYSAWLYVVKGKGVVPRKKPYFGMFVVEGKGIINGMEVKAGESFLIPRGVDNVEFEGNMTILAGHA